MTATDNAFVHHQARLVVALTLQTENVTTEQKTDILDTVGDEIAAELVKLTKVLIKQAIAPTDESNAVKSGWLESFLIPNAKELYAVQVNNIGPRRAAQQVFDWVAEQYGVVDVNMLGLGADGLETVYARLEQALGVTRQETSS